MRQPEIKMAALAIKGSHLLGNSSRKMGFDYQALLLPGGSENRPLSTKASDGLKPGHEIKAPHDEAPHMVGRGEIALVAPVLGPARGQSDLRLNNQDGQRSGAELNSYDFCPKPDSPVRIRLILHHVRRAPCSASLRSRLNLLLQVSVRSPQWACRPAVEPRRQNKTQPERYLGLP